VATKKRKIILDENSENEGGQANTESLNHQQTTKVEEDGPEKNTQESIREILRCYLKEQLTLDEARQQTPKMLRAHIESVLGHSVEEHAPFILNCLRELFASPGSTN